VSVRARKARDLEILVAEGDRHRTFGDASCRSQEVGLALGAQSGEARMRAVFQKAGAKQFRRAAETPFNIIYEAKA